MASTAQISFPSPTSGAGALRGCTASRRAACRMSRDGSTQSARRTATTVGAASKSRQYSRRENVSILENPVIVPAIVGTPTRPDENHAGHVEVNHVQIPSNRLGSGADDCLALEGESIRRPPGLVASLRRGFEGAVPADLGRDP